MNLNWAKNMHLIKKEEVHHGRKCIQDHNQQSERSTNRENKASSSGGYHPSQHLRGTLRCGNLDRYSRVWTSPPGLAEDFPPIA